MVFNLPFLGAVLSLQVIVILYPRRWLKCLATGIALYSLAYYIWYKPDGTYMDVWVFGMNIWGLVVKAINIFWFRDPATLKRSSKHDERRVQTYRRKTRLTKPRGLRVYLYHMRQLLEMVRMQGESVINAVEMLATLRAVGWEFEAKSLPKPPSSSFPRYRFVLIQIFGGLWRYLVLDVGRALINGTSLGHFPLAVEPTEYPITARFALGVYTCLYCRWTLDVPYRVLSIISVSLGLTEPCEWPPLMGAWTEAYSVRRFWILGIPKGHYFSRWGKVFGNFAVAAGLHAYGRVLAHGKARYDWNMFMAHAVAIWVEDHVKLVAQRLGLFTPDSKGSYAIGYLWTLPFTFWTWHYFMEEMIRAGGVVIPAFGASIVDWCTGRHQFTTGNQLVVR